MRFRQRGQAIFLAAVLLLLGISAVIYTTMSSTSVSIANRQADDTARTLALVKEALIGWSASRTPTGSNPNARPGELPCPDTDNNGFAENDDNNDGIDTASCEAGTIGRVPWKTLGIPEPKDSTGETLWYAISGNFRVYRSVTPHIYTSPITSDTLGTLIVYQESTSNPITTQAVAVILAPGVALGTQDRSKTTTMSCTAPSGTYFRNQCASNYLEIYGGVNNATIGGPFISAPSTATFNDRLLVITNADLMPAVEQRVAKEMMSILERYRLATGVYPWADISTGSSDIDHNRHRIPCASALPTNWVDAGITLPNWFTNGCNCTIGTVGTVSWACVIFYAVAKDRLSGSNCATCGSSTAACGSTTSSITTLTVENTSSRVAHLCLTGSVPFTCNPTVLPTGTADLVLITPGAYPGSPPDRIWPASLNAITEYFDDAQNSDNNDENCYYVPTSTNLDRDRIYVVR